MRFSTVFSVLTCGAMALANVVSPNALVSRENGEILDNLVKLHASLDIILPQFDSCEGSKCTVDLSLDVNADVDATTLACADLKGVVSSDLSKTIARVVVDIAQKLDTHKSSCNNKCGDFEVYAKVDVSLHSLLEKLEVAVPKILGEVKSLVTEVMGCMERIKMKLVIGLFA